MNRRSLAMNSPPGSSTASRSCAAAAIMIPVLEKLLVDAGFAQCAAWSSLTGFTFLAEK